MSIAPLSHLPPGIIAVTYAEYAREYLRSLPLEHFMEATAQGRQREITLESLALVSARRADFKVFNELLVQYPRPRQRRPGQVVPDNMVVLSPEPIDAEGSYDMPLQPAGPFWVLEYVSKHNKRKDYEDNLKKYERELKVPYYLVFYPDNQDLRLYQLKGRKYRALPPNEQGRYAIPKIDMEMALLDGWVRFWYQGKLLPLPADLQRDLDEARREVERLRHKYEQEREQRLALEREVEQLRARQRNGRRKNGP